MLDVRKPGLGMRLPWIDTIFFVDMRITTIDLLPQQCITRDTVSITLNGVVFFKVIKANMSNYKYATTKAAETAIRQVVGEYKFDELLTHTGEMKNRLQQIISERTRNWGISIEAVELKNINLPESIVVAMATQAAAEREKRAKVIESEAEKMASQKIKESSDILSGNDVTMRIRTLQALQKVAMEEDSTIIFPIPIDFPYIYKVQ